MIENRLENLAGRVKKVRWYLVALTAVKVAALCLAWLASLFILVFSNRLRRILRVKGIMALERLMGMLLTTVSVEMLIQGVRQSFFT